MDQSASLIPCYNKGIVQGYFIIEELGINEMYPEFASGPQNEKEAMFWDTIVTVFFLITDNGLLQVEEVGYELMKKNYWKIHGRSDRIYYWQVMKHLESINKDVGDGLPDGSCVEAHI
ncbi:hypothetical protein DRH13_05895 [Candidatus Woesebacteria bacterium]|nr:MAG: hypothetical protein DRH13_05895 [Candidatus Woesebacteria bacterium]